MATVTTTILAKPFYSPFERPPDNLALWSPIPRGLRGFTVHNVLTDIKPLDDNIEVFLTGTLPTQYAYVLADLNVSLQNGGATAYDDQFVLNIQNFFQGQDILGQIEWAIPFVDIPIVQESHKGTGTASRDTLFSGPMWSAPGLTGIAWFMAFRNTASSAQTAATVNAFITFWEFDREQIRKFPLNTPVPTRSR